MIRISQMFRLACGAAVATVLWTSMVAAQDSYKVGSTPSGVPFTFLNTETNKVDGVMVDIINAIGAIEDFTPEVEATQWSALIPSLNGNKIDIIAAAMYATPERAKVVAFSEPVYSYGEGLFVAADDDGTYKSLADLEGKTAGVQIGTAYVEPIQSSGYFKEVRIYETIADIMRDVALGRIDAGFGDRPIVAYQLSKGASEVRLVEEYESQMVGDVSIATRQDDTELLERINHGLAEIKASGELDKIIDKWNIE